MREVARWSARVVGVAAATLSLWGAPHGASAGGVGSGGRPATTIAASAGTTPGSTAPDPTDPESTIATTGPDESTPDTSMDSPPDDSAPETSTDDALVGAGDPDSDIDPTTAAIAVVGFVALVALASWWMVRRSDPDAAPMPPQPPSDLI